MKESRSWGDYKYEKLFQYSLVSPARALRNSLAIRWKDFQYALIMPAQITIVVTKFSRWLRWDEKLAHRLEASNQPDLLVIQAAS